MDVKEAVKYVAFHQVLAVGASVVGSGIVGAGAWLAFGDAARIVVNDAPQNWGDAVAVANPTTFAAFAVVGVFVWQVGKTLALVVTIERVAAGGSGSGGTDATAVEREGRGDVSDRLSSIESDVKRHEASLSAASSASGTGSEGTGQAESRRSRRLGAAATGGSGDDDGTASGTGGASGDGAANGDGSRASNRRSNRRASRGSEPRGASGADGSSN